MDVYFFYPCIYFLPDVFAGVLIPLDTSPRVITRTEVVIFHDASRANIKSGFKNGQECS